MTDEIKTVDELKTRIADLDREIERVNEQIDALITPLTEKRRLLINKLYSAKSALEEALDEELQRTGRPPVGTVVQKLYSRDEVTGEAIWDYTGEVIEHSASNPRAFKVHWHKWGNADDDTMIFWEFGMSGMRVLKARNYNYWWPQGRD